MGCGGPFEGAAALLNIGKIHEGPVGHSQRSIQVTQSDVHIHAENAIPHDCQTGCHASGKRRLARATFSGCDDNHGTHGSPPVIDNISYHKCLKSTMIFCAKPPEPIAATFESLPTVGDTPSEWRFFSRLLQPCV
ncbi:hypothetical protein SDC9_53512 [bioreactor metagenome]|uniref:Uncharacterized protein n=1 Tax=bioreactor metagenome TaxID=1076179 RepID=A0A644WTF3_9ZZZZ